MEPNSNEFTNREEVFFIEFDGVIKEPNQRLIFLLFNELFEHYKDFLSIEDYKGIDIHQSLPICMALQHRNIITSLAKREGMDHEEVYSELKKWDPTLYKHCEELEFVKTLIKTINKPFCKTIYIYTPEFDQRVVEELGNIFGANPKIKYCYGDYEEVFAIIPEKITMFVLSEYESLYKLINYESIDYTDVLVANYVRNGYFDDEGNYVPYTVDCEHLFDGKTIRVNQFNPVIFTNQHMNKIIDPVVEDLKKLYSEEQQDRADK